MESFSTCECFNFLFVFLNFCEFQNNTVIKSFENLFFYDGCKNQFRDLLCLFFFFYEKYHVNLMQ